MNCLTKLIGTSVLAAVLSAPVMAQDAYAVKPADTPYTGVLTKRTAIVVASFDKSLKLYRDVLGFQLNGISVDKAGSYGYEVFEIPASVQTRFATFNSGPSQVRSLALVEYPGVTFPKGPRPAVLVLNANGRLDEILAGIKALGLPILPEHPLPSPTQGVGQEVGFTDFDGHRLVLYQFPNPTGSRQADPPNKQ